jgi:adenylate cyclase
MRDLATPARGRVIPENEDLVLGDARRLPMAVMFLDISGFSQRPSDDEAEQALLARVLNLFFTEMIRIAEDYGGTVEKNTGDGLMAYFEDAGGQPPEGGVKRAVSCALTMFEAGTYLINPVLISAGVTELQFRIAIDYGQVTIARLGAARRFNAVVAIGSPANVAAKMLARLGLETLCLVSGRSCNCRFSGRCIGQRSSPSIPDGPIGSQAFSTHYIAISADGGDDNE